MNDSGQLGDGTTNNSSTAVAVAGLEGGVQALAIGVSHTCALSTAGGVACWGWNVSGQLGDGTNKDSPAPVAVSGLESGVSAIVANGQFSCALTSAGGVMCWGSNFRGQLGDGKADDSWTPVAVVGLDSGVSAITAGEYHACAVLNSGAVECWGANEVGELGNGKTKDSSKPVPVAGLGGQAIAVTGGYQHTCVLTAVPDIECWGANDFGSLGDGTADGSLTPVVVSGLTSGVASIDAGDYHTCALSSTAALSCWGANDYGQIGNGATEPQLTPLAVPGLGGVSAYAAGAQHTCAMTSDGQVLCWGNNDYGQLGDGTMDSSSTPVSVSGL